MSGVTKGCPRCPSKQAKMVEEFEIQFVDKIPEQLKKQLLEWVKDREFYVDSYSYEF
jgi:hypothetical protein